MPLEWSRHSLDYGGNWILSTRFGRLDILQYVSGVEGYDQLHAGAITSLTEIAGRLWFAGLEDLLAMKRAAGGPQDLADIERLLHGNPMTGF